MIFSTLDFSIGYWQLPVNPAYRYKTAFCPGPGLGLFQFCRMPFGLSGAPSSFQRSMDKLFHDLPFVATYLDDVLIHSSTIDEHRKHLKLVFDRIDTTGLTLHGSKSNIGMFQVKYLGHVFSSDGMEPDPRPVKTSALCDWPICLSMLATYAAFWDWHHITIVTYTIFLTLLLHCTS